MSNNGLILQRLPLQVAPAVLVFLFAGIVISCSSTNSRISGTYVASGSGSASMIQITQTENGQLTGVLSNVELKANGKIESIRRPFTGVLDNGQITLSFKDLLSSTSLSGSAGGNSIDLRYLGSTGTVEMAKFKRGDASLFKQGADKVLAAAEAVKVNDSLLQTEHVSIERIREVNAWSTAVQTQVSKLPKIRARYEFIEKEMRRLIDRERATRSADGRSQIAEAVTEGNVAGMQTDFEVNQMWDALIVSGSSLERSLATYPQRCDASTERLRQAGAASDRISDWKRTCDAVIATRTEFNEVRGLVVDAQRQIKTVQTEAKERRRDLVDQANRLNK